MLFYKKTKFHVIKILYRVYEEIIGFKPLYNTKHDNIIYNPISSLQELKLDNLLIFDKSYVERLLKNEKVYISGIGPGPHGVSKLLEYLINKKSNDLPKSKP